jgi:hypothetical protein
MPIPTVPQLPASYKSSVEPESLPVISFHLPLAAPAEEVLYAL